jgi:hypothetical protein
MISSVVWNITPCIPLKVNRRFGGTCRLQLEGRKISQAWKQVTSRAAFTLVSCILYSSTLKMKATYLPKRRLTFNGLYSAISQKMKLFRNITNTAMCNRRTNLYIIVGHINPIEFAASSLVPFNIILISVPQSAWFLWTRLMDTRKHVNISHLWSMEAILRIESILEVQTKTWREPFERPRYRCTIILKMV